MLTISELTSRHTHNGLVEWIGLRTKRRGNIISVEEVLVGQTGLDGDHFSGTGKRSVTLIQREHLPVIAALLGRDEIDPTLLRRNIVVSGINLLALRNARFKIGTSEFEGSGICAPCSRMEETFGHGGYNAVRGHGGITAKVISEGSIRTGDEVLPLNSA